MKTITTLMSFKEYVYDPPSIFPEKVRSTYGGVKMEQIMSSRESQWQSRAEQRVSPFFLLSSTCSFFNFK